MLRDRRLRSVSTRRVSVSRRRPSSDCSTTNSAASISRRKSVSSSTQRSCPFATALPSRTFREAMLAVRFALTGTLS